MERNDAQLVEQTLLGDEGAYAVLIDRYMDGVYAFAHRYVRSADEAEDVAQEAFVRAWKHLKKFDQAKNFKTWLFTIARNAALDMIKKKKPMLFSQIAEEEAALEALLAPYLEGEESLPDALFERAMEREDLAAAMGELSPAYRTVLAMRYADGLKFREIAEILGEPIDTVKSKHRRALTLLRKILGGSESPRSSLI